MEKTDYSAGRAHMVSLRNDQAPFDDVKVRRAMSLGTDGAEFMLLFRSEGLPMDYFPFAPGHPAYTPLEELPADIQALYGYDPDLAMEILTEVFGPPGDDGFFFKTKITVEPSPIELEVASVLKDQWSKINVELEINQVDEITFVAETYPLPVPTYEGCVLGSWSTADPLRSMLTGFTSLATGNVDCYFNPEVDDILFRADLELDEAEKTRLTKEAGAIIREDWPTLPMYLDGSRSYWWPWVQNYYGETSITDDAGFCPVIKYMWLDLDLKAEMGY